MRSHSRGLNTKIHLAVDVHGMPVRFFVTDVTVADCSVAEALIAKFKAEYLLADADMTPTLSSDGRFKRA